MGTYYESQITIGITIPSTVKRIGNNAFNGMLRLKSVTIPASVIEIGDYAFCDCDDLATIKFESGSQLKKIGRNAFEDCCFAAFTIPEGVTEIGREAFSNCEKLKSIVIPKSVISLGDSLFVACSALTKAEFEEGINLKRIPESCFNSLEKLTNVKIPAGVEYIGANAFINTKACNSFTIPDTVKYIGTSAFAGSGCKSYTIPDSVIWICEGAFAGYWDTDIIVSTNKTWKKENGEIFDWSRPDKQYDCKVSSDGTLFEKCGDNIISSFNAETKTLTITGYGPMYDYDFDTPWHNYNDLIEKLEFVNTEGGITYIGTNAFRELWKISSITIPDTVEKIGDEAFDSCQSVESLNLGSGVRYIGEKAFTTVGRGTLIDEIHIPAQVEYIGECAFSQSGIKKITFATKDGKSNLKKISRMTFDSNAKLESVTLAEGLEEIEYAAFRGSKITEITFPSTVKFLGRDVFELCDQLTSVNLNEGLEIIDYEALYSAKKLTSITIPSTVYQIGYNGLGPQIKNISDERGGWKDFEGTPYDLETETWAIPAKEVFRSSASQKVYDDKTLDPSKVGPKVTSLVLSDNSLSIRKGESAELTIVEPEDFDGIFIESVSNKEDVATCEKIAANKIKITAIDYGFATITVTAKAGSTSKTATCTVSVVPEVTELSLAESEKTMHVDEQLSIPVNVVPVAAQTMCSFELSVTDLEGNPLTKDSVIVENNIAKSGDILIKALNAGNVKVSVTETASEKTATATINVTNNRIELKYPAEITTATVKSIAVSNNQPLSELADGPYVSGKIFKGWNTSEEDESGLWVDKYTIFGSGLKNALGSDWNLYAKYADAPASGSFTVCTEGEYIYTGKQVKPEVKVYDGGKLLKAGKDYKVSYGKNNTNAYTIKDTEEGFDPVKAPSIIVTGIGNYSDKITTHFVIKPKNISDSDVSVDNKNMIKKVGAKPQSLDPILKWGTVTLSSKNGKDYVIREAGEVITTVSKKDVGVYPITLEGRGNYAGSIDVNCRIISADKVMASNFAIVLKSKKYSYTGKPVQAEITSVKYKGKTLTENLDYKVSYSSNLLPGTATVTVTGIGDTYTGSKSVTYTITGTPISKVQVEWGYNQKPTDLSLKYTGQAVTHLTQSSSEANPSGLPLKVYIKATAKTPEIVLEEGRDFSLAYSNNVNVGKGILLINGRGEYSGSKKVTFAIAGQDLSTAGQVLTPVHVSVDGNVYSESGTPADVAFMQGGTTPSIVVDINGLVLREGIDYTVAYANNKKIAENNREKTGKGKYVGPYVTIKGKGNYAGVAEIPFSIVKKNLNELSNVITNDVAYVNKANNYISKVSVTDDNGRPLVENKDFVVTYYEGLDTDDEYKLNTADKKTVAEGTTITAVISAPDNSPYKGSKVVRYNVIKKELIRSISKASIVINPQLYTGEEIKITKQSQFLAEKTYYAIDKNNKTLLTLGTDFEIVGYQKNIDKGTATVTIKGKGDYTGMKKVTFKIDAEGMHL